MTELNAGAEMDKAVAKAANYTPAYARPPAFIPPYSTDIGIAWWLVGCGGCNWLWTLTGPVLNEDKEWQCQIEMGAHGKVMEAAHTAPLAICRAFLRGHEIDPGGHA